jgi:hypothetical protein
MLVALALAGCGNSANPMVRTAPASTATGADGRLDTTPTPLTLADLDRYPKGSAQAAVFNLIFWAQWGNEFGVYDSYDPVPARVVGFRDLIGSYAAARPGLVTVSPRLVAVRSTSAGAFVALDFLAKDRPPTHDSFVLRRRRGQWRVLFDTVLERSLAIYAQYRTSSDPTQPPDGRSIRAAARAVERYRLAVGPAAIRRSRSGATP